MLTEDLWTKLTTFSEEAVAAALGKVEELQLDGNRGPVSLSESMVNLRELKQLLESLIREEKLIQLPITIQREILGLLDSISKALAGLNTGADEVVNLTTAIEQLNKLTWQYGLHSMTREVVSYTEKMNQLKALQLEAQDLRKELRGGLQTKKNLSTIEVELAKQKSDLVALMDNVRHVTTQVKSDATEIEKTTLSAKQSLDLMQKLSSQLDGIAVTVENAKKQVDTRNQEIAAFADSVSALKKSNEESAALYKLFIEGSEKMISESSSRIAETQKKVDDLLPGAASAGLADAFRQRKEAIAKSRKWWLGAFVASILGLVYAVVWILGETKNISLSTDWWRSFLQRIPLTIPLIWAGWFFGRNFGHVMRLEEVYAFKQAAAASFEGYKKQMKDVSPDIGLPRLCEEAIAIFSASPLHVFDRRTSDETPMNSFLEKVTPKKKTQI